jgi:hypothetical protein
MCFIQQKFTFFLWRAQGRGGGGDLQESSFCHPNADEDGQNPNICKTLASKLLYAISKPYLKHYFGSSLCSNGSQYKSTCPTRVSLTPKGHSKVPLCTIPPFWLQ